MNEPLLYGHYNRQQAIALFGDDKHAESLCDGEWVIFPDIVIWLSDIGEPPPMSHVGAGPESLCVAYKPCARHDARYRLVPAQIGRAIAKAGSVRLFMRPEGSDTYLYLGELSDIRRSEGIGNYEVARFRLRPALPSIIWDRLEGLDVGNTDDGAPDPASVDMALDRLRATPTIQDRLGVLQRVVEYWHGPIQPEDGLPEAEIGSLGLPLPLKWWYGWAGRREEIMSGQNHLFLPQDKARKYWELSHEDGRLLFYLENQGVYRWGTLDHGDDPPVYGRYNDTDPWEPEGVTLSEHLVLACIFQALCQPPYGFFVNSLDKPTLMKIGRVIPPIAIGPWKWLETRFYAKNGAFMWTMPHGDGCDVSIGAKTNAPLQFLKPYLDDSWEAV